MKEKKPKYLYTFKNNKVRKAFSQLASLLHCQALQDTQGQNSYS